MFAVQSKMKNATARALNRTADSVATRAVREISRDLGLRNKDVSIAIRTTKARIADTNPVAFVRASGRRIPLTAFVKPSAPEQVVRQLRDIQSGRRGGGVSYAIGNVRKTLRSSFIAQMPSGHIGVFLRRKGAKWVANARGEGLGSTLKIDERLGPSISKSFINRKVQAALRSVIDTQLVKEMKHQATFYAGKLGVRID